MKSMRVFVASKNRSVVRLFLISPIWPAKTASQSLIQKFFLVNLASPGNSPASGRQKSREKPEQNVNFSLSTCKGCNDVKGWILCKPHEIPGFFSRFVIFIPRCNGKLTETVQSAKAVFFLKFFHQKGRKGVSSVCSHAGCQPFQRYVDHID